MKLPLARLHGSRWCRVLAFIRGWMRSSVRYARAWPPLSWSVWQFLGFMICFLATGMTVLLFCAYFFHARDRMEHGARAAEKALDKIELLRDDIREIHDRVREHDIQIILWQKHFERWQHSYSEGHGRTDDTR